MRLRRGDEIVVSPHDHYVATASAALAARRRGARLRQVRLYPPEAPQHATLKGIVDAYAAALNRRTRAVVVTWVHSSSGLRMPLRAIADVVHRKSPRALLVVDGAHALGTGPIDIAATGADVFSASGHKWLMGPRGTGVLWARERAWARMAPIIPPFRGGLDDEAPGKAMTPGGYHSFEHRWALADAFKLHADIGSARIADRIESLSSRLRDGLGRLPAVTLHAPNDRALLSGVVTFSVRGLSAPQTAERLARAGVLASSTPYRVELARLGTTWMNTEAEVDAAIEAVAALDG